MSYAHLTIQQALEDVAAWRKNNPGLRTTTPYTCLSHLREEIDELEEMLETRAPLHAVAYELADLLILLADLSNMIGVRLPLAFQAKLAIINDRIYDVTTADGHVKHRKGWTRARNQICAHCTAPAYAIRISGEPIAVCAHHYQLELAATPVELLKVDDDVS